MNFRWDKLIRKKREKMKKTYFMSIACSLICSLLALPAAGAQTVELRSPDGSLSVPLRWNEEGMLVYQFSADGKLLIDKSILGLTASGKSFDMGLVEVTSNSVDTVWKPVWGKRAVVTDKYNQVSLKVKDMLFVARAYNDGVAFRYENLMQTPETDSTQFNFAGDYTAWFYNGERHNLGPDKLTDCDGNRRPVMTVMAGPDQYMAIHEAALSSGDPLVLKSTQGQKLFSVASGPNNAWRVIMFGRTPGALVDSHIIELLNPPPAEGSDFSWVKPGVAVWDWRINGATAAGFKYGMNLPSWKRMVDFSSSNGIAYLVLDANWYGPEFAKDADPTKGGKVADVMEIIRYGKTKNVGVWLYLNDVGGRKFPLEQTLKQYSEWGAAGIKYGFMRGSPREKNDRTRLITELCAKNRLLCDYHDGPVHPYGQMRTYPNAVTREFCHAQLDAHRVFAPKTFVTAVFVNMLAGPLDMNNGLADLTQAGRVDQSSPVPSTLAGEAARTLIVFSGATIIPDIPENYNKHPEILRFIAAQKMPWMESRTISGEIGKYIIMARKASDGTWLVGAATDEEPRELDIPLSFLDSGKYEATIIQDGPKSDYRTHMEDYTADKKHLTGSDVIKVKLAPGGGACVILARQL
jgi:alpha-glucosidase